LFKRKPEDPDPVAGRGRPLLSIELEGKPAHWSVKFADLTLSDYIVPKSSQVTAELKIKLEDSVTNPRKGIYLPTASFNHDGTKTQLSVIETTTAEDLDNKTLLQDDRAKPGNRRRHGHFSGCRRFCAASRSLRSGKLT
jgi:hypothetical protein